MENQETKKYQNPMEYLKIFFRRKWLFIAPVYAGLIISIIACFVLPPVYESNTLILVEEEKIINPLIQGLAVSTTAYQRMQNIREQILGWNSLVDLTKKLNLAKDAQTQMQFENLILNLRQNIGVQMRGHNIVKISYFGKNPQETRLITKTLADNLVDENMRLQTKEADLAIGFIKEQLEVYKRKIKESEIAGLEEQLKRLLVDSTEQHPLVKEIRHKITTAKSELESGDYKLPALSNSKEDAAYKALQGELDKMIKDETSTSDSQQAAYADQAENSHDPNTAIYKLMLMDKLETAQSRDKNINERIYNMLLQKLETAKITQRLETSKQGTRYTVLDPPRMPLRPSKPNKLKVIFLGVFMGACAGTGLVFGREFMDHSFLDIEDAKKSLELPILGAISRLTTQEEIDKEKYRVRRIVTTVVAVSLAVVVAVMIISFLRK